MKIEIKKEAIEEIAGFIPDKGEEAISSKVKNRSIHLHNTYCEFETISKFNGAYNPTHYVLMFLHSEFGFHFDMNTTALSFYQQRLQVREHQTLGRFGRLFHEYVIDQQCKIEKNNLNFIKF